MTAISPDELRRWMLPDTEPRQARPDEGRLPLWAQVRLEQQRQTIARLQAERDEALRVAEVVDPRHAHRWFTLDGPRFAGEWWLDRGWHLWALDADTPHAVCVLYPGDRLIVGRDVRRGWRPLIPATR